MIVVMICNIQLLVTGRGYGWFQSYDYLIRKPYIFMINFHYRNVTLTSDKLGTVQTGHKLQITLVYILWSAGHLWLLTLSEVASLSL
jgi:hypothetical protein